MCHICVNPDIAKTKETIPCVLCITLELGIKIGYLNFLRDYPALNRTDLVSKYTWHCCIYEWNSLGSVHLGYLLLFFYEKVSFPIFFYYTSLFLSVESIIYTFLHSRLFIYQMRLDFSFMYNLSYRISTTHVVTVVNLWLPWLVRQGGVRD